MANYHIGCLSFGVIKIYIRRSQVEAFKTPTASMVNQKQCHISSKMADNATFKDLNNPEIDIIYWLHPSRLGDHGNGVALTASAL